MARLRLSAPIQKQRRGRGGLPSAQEVLAFIRESPTAIGKREIARAFSVLPADRPALRDMLRQIERSGAVTRAANRRLTGAPALPEVTVVERFGTDEDGVGLARPVAWPGPNPAPALRLAEEPGEGIPIGARAAARLVALESGEIEARIIRRLDPGGERIVGVFEKDREGGRVVPADRRRKIEFRIAERDAAGLDSGELVVAENLTTARLGSPRARIVERLGKASDPAAISLLVIASFDIPTEFPPAAIAEAEAALPVDTIGRADLRELPLVTIDGSDARDFDDAVWAEPDPDPANPGGWHLMVAIADVAWYVRPGSALDREAERRGNSVYFPDRVVPMLPEALSNELCSLKPGVDRACLAAELTIDAAGGKRRHRFLRAVMRSAARLTYEEIQAVRDGHRDPPAGISSDRVAALYGAFDALGRARAARGALELDIREDRVVLDADGRPVAVVPRLRLDSHRLIEEFMILANVAAAEELEARRQPCMYRIHDAPDPEKVASLGAFLGELGLPGLALAKGQAPKPELFNRLLRRAEGAQVGPLVNDLVLRCQAQAVYSPLNIGHFGLGLRRYAHFTSPIRRYADLLVHRALIAGANAAGRDFGAGALPRELGPERMAAIGEHISATERRAAAAERAAIERCRTTLVAGAVGGLFAARITGVAEFGLFVTLAESGATGLAPISTLPGDYYDRHEQVPRLVGRRFGRVFRLGDAATVRLVEADAIGGRLLFRIEDDTAAARRGRGALQTRLRRGG
ncbi:MAG TPA: ribonuclease R [Stellaceae bacterium]|jgi:ribonuclease R